jgi:hypothetical protein
MSAQQKAKLRRKATPRTLLKRRITAQDLPITVGFARWTPYVHAVALPIIAAATAFLASIGYGMATLGDWTAVAWLTLLIALFLIGSITGIDHCFRYQLLLDSSGITLKGNITSRYIRWDEITHFSTWRNRGYTGDGGSIPLGFQARIHVDGSNNPRRILRNLFFAGYFTPPFLELGGKDLVKLLTKAKRELEGLASPSTGDVSSDAAPAE